MMFSHGTVSKTKQLIPRHSLPRCGRSSYSIYVSKSALHPQASVLNVSYVLCNIFKNPRMELMGGVRNGFLGDKHLRGGSAGSHTEILCLIEPLKTTFYLNKVRRVLYTKVRVGCVCVYIYVRCIFVIASLYKSINLNPVLNPIFVYFSDKERRVLFHFIKSKKNMSQIKNIDDCSTSRNKK